MDRDDRDSSRYAVVQVRAAPDGAALIELIYHKQSWLARAAHGDCRMPPRTRTDEYYHRGTRRMREEIEPRRTRRTQRAEGAGRRSGQKERAEGAGRRAEIGRASCRERGRITWSGMPRR